MHEKRHLTSIGIFVTLAGAILFSTKAVIVKKAFQDIHIDALTLLMLRMLFALPFYVAVLLWTKDEKQVSLTGQQWIQLIGLGLMGYYLSSYLDFAGLQYISAGLERLILYLYPTFVVLINFFVFKQSLTRIQKFAVALTYAGILLAYVGEFDWNNVQPGHVWGAFLVFLCSITFAVYIVGSGKLIPAVGATRFTVYAMLAAIAGILLHYLIQNQFHFSVAAVTSYWQYGLLLAVVATVLPTFLTSAGVKQIGSSNVAIISSIGPVSTIIQAHFILGEQITALQIAGTLLVIAGILLIGMNRERWLALRKRF
jgi:drug/metabolite transporter (DMT)-like permease